MTAHYASGSFDSSGVGNQSISGLGFAPSLVIFFGYGKDPILGPKPDALQFIGAASSPNNRWATSRFSPNGAWTGHGVQNYICSSAQTSTKCISLLDSVGFTLDADIVSMDADGFTIHWYVVTAQTKVFYLAIGGINATCGTFYTGLATGHEIITGLGYTPTGVMFQGTDDVGTTIGELPGVSGCIDAMGAAVSSTNRWATNEYEAATIPLTVPQVYFGSNKCFTTWGNADRHYEADFVSLDADGFTINCTFIKIAPVPHDQNINFIAFGGIDVAIGSFESGTTGSDVVVNGLGFQPGALIITSMDYVAENVQRFPSFRSLGMGISAAKEQWAGYRANGGGDTSVTENHSNAGEDGISVQFDNSAAVVQKLAIKTMDADGFTLKSLLTDNTSRRNYYIALGSPVVPVRRHGHTLPACGVG